MSNENSIIKRLKNGDESAFDIIYDSYYKLIYFIVYKYLKNPLDTEELVNDVFIKMYNSINQYTMDKSFKYWLITIAKNMSINEVNKRNKSRIVYDDDAVLARSNHEESNERDIIEFINNNLEEYEARIVVLICIFDFKFKEIALNENENQSKISSIYYRALKKLEKKWGDYKEGRL